MGDDRGHAARRRALTPVVGGWVKLGDPKSIDPGLGTTPAPVAPRNARNLWDVLRADELRGGSGAGR
jgi:hypothetical protein